MGNVTIYIRPENELKWKSIRRRSEWVNKQLEEYKPQKPVAGVEEKS